ncbi:hypothetical protein KRX19_01455 [Cardiobacteriaceae bacterium TAE3-ERU3]|nr:hypothetical protein [Cardiobacteriaceae bacterium TAE3-ERU3]
MKQTSWPTIKHNEYRSQTPFIHDGQRYITQAKVAADDPIWPLTIVALLAVVPLFLPIDKLLNLGRTFSNTLWYITLLGFAGYSWQSLQFNNRLKRFKRFSPHTLAMIRNSWSSGEVFMCEYLLTPLKGQIGEPIDVSARIVCQEEVEVERGTETAYKINERWAITQPKKRFLSKDTGIRYTIEEELPAELSSSIRSAKHQLHWYVQIRLDCVRNPPFFVVFRINVS